MSTDQQEPETARVEEETHDRTAHTARDIGNAIVSLLSRRAGRGPTRAKTTLTAELAVVAISDWLTTAEKTLMTNGHEGIVLHGRAALGEGIRREATAAVEQITGRRIVAYFTGHDPQANAGVVVFIFDRPTALRAA